jgi:hypothetical protein
MIKKRKKAKKKRRRKRSRKVCKSAVTGRFVSRKFGEDNPETTYWERLKGGGSIR